MSPSDILNFREVCPWARDRLAAGRLFRSSSLAQLTPAQIRRIVDTGIATYVDLRSDGEISRDGAPQGLLDAGVEWIHVPLGDYDRSRVAEGKPSSADYLASYLSMASECGPGLALALRTIAERGERPVVLGCQTGKDRTGVVVALVLESLGIPRSLVARDYAGSGPALREGLDRLQHHWIRRGLSRQEYAERLETPPSVLHEFLSALDRRPGGPMGVVLQGGLGLAEIDALRERLRGER